MIDYEIHRTGQTFRETVEQLSQNYQISLEYEKGEEKGLSDRHKTDLDEKITALEMMQKQFELNFLTKLQPNLKKVIEKLGLQAFPQIGFTSNQHDLLKLKTQMPQQPIPLSEEYLADRITFPLIKDNGKIYGFAITPRITEEYNIESSDFLALFDPLQILSVHKFGSHLLNWSSARSWAAKEKSLVLTTRLEDGLLLLQNGIQNTTVFLQQKIDQIVIKNLLGKFSKIILALPFSEKGKSFLWQIFQDHYAQFESHFFVLFIQDDRQYQSEFFSKKNLEKVKKWISLADKMIYKIMDLCFENTHPTERMNLFKSKIFPVVKKITQEETKRAILLDLAKKYFDSSEVNIFYSVSIPHTEPIPASPQKNLNPHPFLKQTMSRVAEFYHKILLSPRGEQARHYLQDRGFSTDHILRWKLGLCPFDNTLTQRTNSDPVLQQTLDELGLIRKSKNRNQYYDFFYNRIIIPISSHEGHIIALAGRVFQPSDSQKQMSKYINSMESHLFSKSHVLFHFYAAMESIVKEKYVLVVEGYMDCIALANAGITNVVAVMGTALTPFHVQCLSKLTNRIMLCFDNDKAGQNAARRSFQASHAYPDVQLEYLALPAGKDPDEFIKQFGAQKFLDVIQKNKIPLYEKIFEWAAQESQDQQDLVKIFERELSALLQTQNKDYLNEITSFVKLKYDIDLKNIEKSNRYLKSQPILSLPKEKKLDSGPFQIPDWSIKNSFEIKFLFELVHLKLTELPKRLLNLLQGISSENENNEKICGLSLKSQLSQTSFDVFVELCTWMLAHPDQTLSSYANAGEFDHFSNASQILLGYVSRNVKTLFAFQLEEFAKDHLSSSGSVITSKNLWSLNNSGFLKFHLHNAKLALQNGVLPCYLADTLFQLEMDYIDSTLKTLSSFHFDNDVNEQFQYFISEQIRRRVELKVL